MQSIFEPKTTVPFDASVLERMRKTASALIACGVQNQNAQALVLYSSSGNEYSAHVTDALSIDHAVEAALLEKLRVENDTKMEYVFCMWQDGCIDVPSMMFRKMLVDRNAQNTDARLFVQTKKGVQAIRLGGTMK
jgi:hypothetical protein